MPAAFLRAPVSRSRYALAPVTTVAERLADTRMLEVFVAIRERSTRGWLASHAIILAIGQSLVGASSVASIASPHARTG